jgi:ABC-type nitrate/sulfonate/bicarbonate transport system permease component
MHKKTKRLDQTKTIIGTRRRLSFLSAIVPVAIATAWALVSAKKLVDPVFVPGPIDVWVAWRGLKPLLFRSVLVTLGITLSGFSIGVAVGTGLGLVMAYSRIFRELVGTAFDFLRPVPIFALIPLFILWFGIGRTPQVVLIALGTSVILGVTTLEAIRNVPGIYVRAALMLGARRREIYLRVIVPSIIPHLIGAIRVAAAASWGLDVAAEFLGSQVGMGYLIIMQQVYLRTAGIVTMVIIYAVLAVGLDSIIRIIEARITRWTERRSMPSVVGAIVGQA